MKKIIIASLAIACAAVLSTSCIKEIDPQQSVITLEQVTNAPGSFDNLVNATTNSLCGSFTYSGSSHTPYDFGYPAFYLMRDVMGNDIVCETSGSEWYSTWYGCGTGLGPQYAVCQYPWTYYFKWIKNCNIVIDSYLAAPTEDKNAGVGIAYALRAMFNLDLAQMFAPKTYATDKNAPTVPIITEETKLEDLSSNPRATNEVMFAQILSDLSKAEEFLANYKRADKYTPDLSVVYGFKARAYLIMADWANAQKYAKMAQNGYAAMNAAQYTDQKTGFNTPNSSWMFGLTFKADDPNILENDADSCWGSQMIIEVSPSGCGYSANYVGPKRIDKHLFQSIPDTDFRKMCWVDFKLDEIETEEELIDALSAYSDDPEGLFNTGINVSVTQSVGGMPIKFRPKDGEHKDQYKAFTVAVPIMRVEEMMLIEAEAAGMQNEAEGIALLTKFAQSRDPEYVYGTHNDAYHNTKTSKFQNECWWQRRVELWGEGLAMYDIKRLEKGVIRSYSGTNHPASYRWNVDHTPDWMTFCIVQTETNYNAACEQNPIPVKPTEDSPEFVW